MAIVDFNPKKHFAGRPRWHPHSGCHEDICCVGSELMQQCARMTDDELVDALYNDGMHNWDLVMREVHRRYILGEDQVAGMFSR